MNIELEEGWIESETGNTLLVNDEGDLAAWIQLGPTLALEVTNSPASSPQFYCQIVVWGPKNIRKHVMENLQGWHVVRWNIDTDAPVDEYGDIEHQDEQ